jgi:hypothetical protein
LKYSIKDSVGGAFDDLPEWVQKMICASEEIGGARPSVEEITERNVEKATANAQEPRPHPPVGINESSADDIDEDQLNAELTLAADVDALTR